MKFRPLPSVALEILQGLNAPSRLLCHLELVHDCAYQILDLLQGLGAKISIPCDEILLGAALHDIGKIKHPEELSEPGKAHEAAGYDLLIEQGLEPGIAKYCQSHGFDLYDGRLNLDDLIVMLADKIWKGRRIEALEEKIISFAKFSGEPWDVFLTLDAGFEAIASKSDDRLAYQGQA